MKKTFPYLLLLLLLTLPSYSLMLRPGIYSMHDFHPFRQFEFNKCVREGSFPCRWAPDAGMGYGQPLFNFYGQFAYWGGEIFHLFGFSLIDSVKILFILSLVVSAWAMFVLARSFFGPLGAVVSALFYVYAPYRAVDVWVRGALPESLAFIFFPLLVYFVEKKKYFFLALGLAGLLMTHNLSLLMFAPFLGWWLVYRARVKAAAPAAILALLLSAYYLLPVVVESRFVTLGKTTQNYYDWRSHFTSLRQLFVSRFWGYGGSVWGPNDTMSFSVGHLHWITPLILAPFLFRRKEFFLFALFGLFAIFLTHGKSEFVWKLLPPLAYIQFPWRFLTLATFFLSFASGAIALYFRRLIPLLLLLLLLLNVGFFKPDIWRNITDSEQFSGRLWDEQRSSALQDFWPKSAPRQPVSFAPEDPGAEKKAHSAKFLVTGKRKVEFPVVYFPGWKAQIEGRPLPIFPGGELGLITADVPPGVHQVDLKFTDTWPRSVGNLISLGTLVGLGLWQIGKKRWFG